VRLIGKPLHTFLNQQALPAKKKDRQGAGGRRRGAAPQAHALLENRRASGVSRAAAARIGKARGLSRLSALEPEDPVIRYEKEAPGDMIHIDIKRLGRIDGIGHRITGDRKGQANPRSRKQRGHGWEYLHLAVDDHSRLAYSEILPDEKRKSCLRFLFNALEVLLEAK
jgi:hypothetical protein